MLPTETLPKSRFSYRLELPAQQANTNVAVNSFLPDDLAIFATLRTLPGDAVEVDIQSRIDNSIHKLPGIRL